MPSCSNGAQARLTERCWRTAAGSWSLTVVPSVTEPARLIVPVDREQRLHQRRLPRPGVAHQHHVAHLAGCIHHRRGAGDSLLLRLLRHGTTPCRTDGADERLSRWPTGPPRVL